MKTRLAALATVLALIAAACGGEGTDGVASLQDDTETTTTSVTNTDVDQEEALLAFTECLREQGLDVEDPEFDGEGGFGFAAQIGGGRQLRDEEVQAAFEECQPLIEDVVGQFEQRDLTEIEDQLLAFAECMRDQGIDMDDPQIAAPAEGGGPGGGGPFGALDFEDPEVQAALEVCQAEFGGFGRSGAAPTGRGERGDG